jgi:hypothetical protein
MTRDQLVALIIPLLILALLIAAGVWALRQRSRMDRAAVRRAAPMVEPDLATPPRDPRPPGRPWWGSPWTWVAVVVVFLVLGLLVWPWLFGGVLLFVPFVWMSRPRTPTMDPRTNGHAKRDGPAA